MKVDRRGFLASAGLGVIASMLYGKESSASESTLEEIASAAQSEEKISFLDRYEKRFEAVLYSNGMVITDPQTDGYNIEIAATLIEGRIRHLIATYTMPSNDIQPEPVRLVWRLEVDEDGRIVNRVDEPMEGSPSSENMALYMGTAYQNRLLDLASWPSNDRKLYLDNLTTTLDASKVGKTLDPMPDQYRPVYQLPVSQLPVSQH